MEKPLLLQKLIKLEHSGANLYLMSVFDLDPSGIRIIALSQDDFQEYSWSISEEQLANASVTRHVSSLTDLLHSIRLVPKGPVMVLESFIENICDEQCADFDIVDSSGFPTIDTDAALIEEILITGLLELCKTKLPMNDAIRWLGEWLIENNPKNKSK